MRTDRRSFSGVSPRRRIEATASGRGFRLGGCNATTSSHQINLDDLDNTPDTPVKRTTRTYLLTKARIAKGMVAQFINHYDLGHLRSEDPSATDYWIINNPTYWFGGDPVEIHRAFINSAYYCINNREEKWYSTRGDSTYGVNLINLALTECKSLSHKGNIRGLSTVEVV